jgi:hypothetical protein
MYKMPNVKIQIPNKCKNPNKKEAAYFQTAILISGFELVLTLGFLILALSVYCFFSGPG